MSVLLSIFSLSASVAATYNQPVRNLGYEQVLAFGRLQDVPPDRSRDRIEFPSDEGLGNFCKHVAELTAEDHDPRFKYHYQTLMHEAAGILPDDVNAQIARKMNILWDMHLKNFTCANLSFNVNNGNLIKYAISSTSDSFIYDVSRKWRFDLNQVDPSDRRTALDYAYDELSREARQGSNLVNKLETYIRLLEAAGAKRSKDLR